MGKKSSPKAPKAPDPYATAQAQTGTNVGTAIANAWLGNANETSPYGNVSYTSNGTQTFQVPGEDGRMVTYTVPTFDRSVTLDPAEQHLLDQQRAIGSGMNDLAAQQTQRLTDVLGQPISGSGLPARADSPPPAPKLSGAQDAERMARLNMQYFGSDAPAIRNSFGGRGDISNVSLDEFNSTAGNIQSNIDEYGYPRQRRRVEDALYSRLNPQLERDRMGLETNLINQGFARGSEAFNRAMDEHGRQANDARMQTVLAGGQEQSRLAGLALQAGQFKNAAQQQAFNQQTTGYGLNQNAQLAQAGFNNQAQQQGYDQALGRAGFANAAQQQNFSQDALGYGLNQQRDLSQAGFNNQSRQQDYQNAMKGTEYNNMLNQQQFGNQAQRVDMQNQMRERALQEELALRNQPINEISALMAGGQVNVPQFSPYQGGQVGNTNLGQMVYNSAQQDQNSWMQQQQMQAQQNAGLYGLLGTGLSGMFGMMSDRRLKRAVRDLGVSLANGLAIYAYRYLWDAEGTERVGVMADEVRAVMPGAVTRLGGYDAVNYDMAVA